MGLNGAGGSVDTVVDCSAPLNEGPHSNLAIKDAVAIAGIKSRSCHGTKEHDFDPVALMLALPLGQ